MTTPPFSSARPSTSWAAGRRPRATRSSAITPDGPTRQAGTLGEPLSDLGAAVAGKTAYIAGGYTGSQYATGILAFRGGTPTLAARLPAGLRYAGVAVARRDASTSPAGSRRTGTSRAVYRFDPATGRRRRRSRRCRAPVAHAPLVALGGALYLLGGDGQRRRLAHRAGRHRNARRAASAPARERAAVALGGSSYVFGGDGSDAVLRLTPKTR